MMKLLQRFRVEQVSILWVEANGGTDQYTVPIVWEGWPCTAQCYPKGHGHSVRKNGSRTPPSLPTPTARLSQPPS